MLASFCTVIWSASLKLAHKVCDYLGQLGHDFWIETLLLRFITPLLALWAPQAECHPVPLYSREGRHLHGPNLLSRCLINTAGERENMYFEWPVPLIKSQSYHCSKCLQGDLSWCTLWKCLNQEPVFTLCPESSRVMGWDSAVGRADTEWWCRERCFAWERHISPLWLLWS